ncbi:MAG: phosphoenolpyruvate--protein phosphotransferase [Kiritimatiellia bacterium]|nr:phosphoenolpyruvate--protein phosphotransferase [Kiritimatiellia bacterium]
MTPNPVERTLQGIGVSPGVARAPAFLLTTEDLRIVERDIGAEDIPREIARLEEALIATRKQLREIQSRVEQALDRSSASIFDAHLLVLDDRAFIEEVVRGLDLKRKNVEFVLHSVAERFAATLAGMEDDYLRERAADLRDVSRRLLRNLSGENRSLLAHLDHPCIIVAHDIAPSDAATLNREKVVGFVTDLGSTTSHTAIMARALEIPAVVGLHDASVRISSGEELLLDGGQGLVLVAPSEASLKTYGQRAQAQEQVRTSLEPLRNLPAETLDGYRIHLAANIELPQDVDAVLRHGAAGVGLFRSEFLFLQRDTLPDEEEQTRAYTDVARRLAPEPVIIRTMDIGGDKFVSSLKMPVELNPFMGWRAIRFSLAQPEIFLTQLRAILRASASGNVKIMYPMISTVDEVLRAGEFLEQAKRDLRRKGVPFDENIESGIMIEVPSAALTARALAPHVRFFSIGTNDLIQYTLAVDRVNERIAYLYEPTHPAILRLIKTTIDASHEAGIWTGICGEMAGDPTLTALLIGLGADELSVSPVLAPQIKGVIRRLDFPRAEALAEQALRVESAAQVRDMCRTLTKDVAPDIFSFFQ